MAAPTKKKHNARNRKTKTFLEFDDKARTDYLKGFHKRKNERRKIAKEKNDKRVMEERKTLIKQFREQQKSKRSTQDSDVIPEIKHLVDPKVYNLPEHTVTIADFGDIDFVGNSGVRLGKNTGLNNCDDAKKSDADDSPETPVSGHISMKTFQKKLSACSSQLSSSQLKVKKANKKQHLKAKLKAKKKGKKGQKGGKRK